MARVLPAGIAAVVLIACAPVRVGAQPLTAFSDLAHHVGLDQDVRVKDVSGQTTAGIVTGLTPSEIVLRAGRTIIRFRADEVREVRVRGDSLVNGAVIGLLVGGTLGAVAAGNFAGGGFRAGDAVQGALILGGVGLGIGVGLDALVVGSRLVYRAPPAVASTSDRGSAALVWYAGVRW